VWLDRICNRSRNPFRAVLPGSALCGCVRFRWTFSQPPFCPVLFNAAMFLPVGCQFGCQLSEKHMSNLQQERALTFLPPALGGPQGGRVPIGTKRLTDLELCAGV